MDNGLERTLERLKAGKRAGGMEYEFIDGVAYVKRSEVIGLEKEYWELEAENKALKAQLKLAMAFVPKEDEPPAQENT